MDVVHVCYIQASPVHLLDEFRVLGKRVGYLYRRQIATGSEGLAWHLLLRAASLPLSGLERFAPLLAASTPLHCSVLTIRALPETLRDLRGLLALTRAGARGGIEGGPAWVRCFIVGHWHRKKDS
jgi:hypothetical protein